MWKRFLALEHKPFTNSVTGFHEPPPIGICSFTFSGTTDGPITAIFKNLAFTGRVTGGTYEARSFVLCDDLICEGTSFGSFTAPFTGFWSNGWYSTGTLVGLS